MRQKNMGSAGAIKIAVFPRYFTITANSVIPPESLDYIFLNPD